MSRKPPQPAGSPRLTATGLQENNLPSAEETGMDEEAILLITSNLQAEKEKRTRTQFTPTQRAQIGRYAAEHGVAPAVRHFQGHFPSLLKGTVSRMKAAYEQKKRSPDAGLVEAIGKKRGRPSILPEDILQKLEKFLILVHRRGGTVNKHVVNCILHGIVASKPAWAPYLHFTPSRGWLNALYKRLNITKPRAARPPASEAASLDPTMDKLLGQSAFTEDISSAIATALKTSPDVPIEEEIEVDTKPSEPETASRPNQYEEVIRELQK